MEPIDYLRALRQWWLVIVVLSLIGFLAAFVTSSSGPPVTYSATHILIQDTDNTDAVSLARAAFLVTAGDVPNRVAERLGEDPRVVVGGVSAETDPDLNGLRITAVEDTPARAVEIADTFAEELVVSLDERATKVNADQVAAQRKIITDLQAQLAGVPPLSPQAESLQNQLDQAQSDLDELSLSLPSDAGLSKLQSASASRDGGSTSRVARLAIGTIMGFLLGLVAALVLARFDNRIRTKEAAESAFGAPVVAEVPPLKRAYRSRRAIVAVSDPESFSAEVYRGLRTALVVSSHARPSRDEEPRRTGPRRPTQPAKPQTRVVLVASPGMGEGKTTTSANLAVAFAETGRRVLLLGCDLRRPELHNYFGVDNSPGLTDELAKAPGERSLRNIIRDTQVPGVRIAPSGDPIEHPGELLTRGLDLVKSSREYADVVVIDTAPLLATDDASVLIALADDVVIVCRSGRTSLDAATRTRELLSRLRAPVAGIVLIGAQQLASARSYYRVDYRSRTRPRSAGSGSVEREEGEIADGTGNANAPGEIVVLPGTAKTEPAG